MQKSIAFTPADIAVLVILAVLFLLGTRVLISFFRTPKMASKKEELPRRIDEGSRISVTLDGMMCGMCEMHIKDGIRKAVPGAKMVTASHTTGNAQFVLPKRMTGKELNRLLHREIDPQGYRILGLSIK